MYFPSTINNSLINNFCVCNWHDEEYDSDHSIEIFQEQSLTSNKIVKVMCLLDEAMDIKNRSWKCRECCKKMYCTFSKHWTNFLCKTADLRQQLSVCGESNSVLHKLNWRDFFAYRRFYISDFILFLFYLRYSISF